MSKTNPPYRQLRSVILHSYKFKISKIYAASQFSWAEISTQNVPVEGPAQLKAEITHVHSQVHSNHWYLSAFSSTFHHVFWRKVTLISVCVTLLFTCRWMLHSTALKILNTSHHIHLGLNTASSETLWLCLSGRVLGSPPFFSCIINSLYKSRSQHHCEESS